MNRFPLFSIVIPTYNRAALIERTLATIWQQTYPHYEVIVVDNCSEDRGSADAICQSRADSLYQARSEL